MCCIQPSVSPSDAMPEPQRMWRQVCHKGQLPPKAWLQSASRVPTARAASGSSPGLPSHSPPTFTFTRLRFRNQFPASSFQEALSSAFVIFATISEETKSLRGDPPETKAVDLVLGRMQREGGNGGNSLGSHVLWTGEWRAEASIGQTQVCMSQDQLFLG